MRKILYKDNFMKKALIAVICCLALFTVAACSKDGGKSGKKINNTESYTVTISGSPDPGTHTNSGIVPMPLFVTLTAVVTNNLTGETVTDAQLTWSGAPGTGLTTIAVIMPGTVMI
jgi:hypothetical protein